MSHIAAEIKVRKLFISRYIIIALLTIFSTLTIAQPNSNIDSLLNILEASNNPDQRFEILLLIIQEYQGIDDEKALVYCRTAMIQAEAVDNQNLKADLYFIIGGIYENSDEYDLAISNYNSSLELYSLIGDKREEAKLYYSLGDIYKKKGLYQYSLENCLKGLRIYESLNDSLGLSNVYNVMGSLYKYQNNNSKSLEYYNKSLDLRTGLNELNGMAMSYNNIGVVYEIEGNTDLALDYYYRGLSILTETGDKKNQGITLGNIASIYLVHNEPDKALEYITRSLEIHNELSYARGIANQYQNLGNYYDYIGDLTEAIEYTEKAYKLFKSLGRLEDEKDAAAELSDLLFRDRNYKQAYEYLIIFKELSDKIFDNEKIKNIARMENEYSHLKEDEIRNLKDQKSRLVNTVIFFALVLISVIVVSFYSRLRIKSRQQSLEILNVELEKKQIETELDLKAKKMAADSIYLVKKNEIITKVIDRLTEAKANLKEENVPIITNIINDLTDSLDTDIWKDFELRFLDVHHNFYENLQDKFPELTSNEKRISAFLRLDMSTKEISSITNQTPHSINIARTRLRKKLGLANTEISISAFLSQF